MDTNIRRTRILSIIILFVICSVFLVLFQNQPSGFEDDLNDHSATIQDDFQLESDMDEPLTIFYEEESSILLLLNLQNAYPDIQFNAYMIAPTTKGNSIDIDEYAKKYGNPDIILYDSFAYTGQNKRIQEWYQQGWITDISEFYVKDSSIIESEYIPGVFETLTYGDALLGLPLSWSIQGLIVRESKAKESALALLPDDYTGEELFQALLKETENRENGVEFFWPNWISTPIDLLLDMNEVKKRENGEVCIDEALFHSLYEFDMKRTIIDEYAKSKYGSLGEYMSRYVGDPSLDPAMYEGRYFGCSIFGAPQISVIYAKSVAKHCGEDIQMYWIPASKNGKEYVGEIRQVAFVSGRSTRQKQAYKVIRMMMDMPIEVIPYQANGCVPQICSPVNIKQALTMLDYFDELEVSHLTINNALRKNHYQVEKQKLSDEEKERIQKIIKGMVKLRFEFDTDEIYSIYHSYKTYCLEGGSINHKRCYNEILQALNRN